MMTNLYEKIIAYENGELEYEEVVELFQRLLDSKIIYSLQGSYQRHAQALLDAGELL